MLIPQVYPIPPIIVGQLQYGAVANRCFAQKNPTATHIWGQLSVVLELDRVRSTMFTKTPHSSKILCFSYHASQTSIARGQQYNLFGTDQCTHPHKTYILVSSLSPATVAYLVQFLRLTSLRHRSVQHTLRLREWSLIISIHHQTAKPFDLLPRLSILVFFMDYTYSPIRMFCLVFISFHGKHAITLCLLDTVASLLL